MAPGRNGRLHRFPPTRLPPRSTIPMIERGRSFAAGLPCFGAFPVKFLLYCWMPLGENRRPIPAPVSRVICAMVDADSGTASIGLKDRYEDTLWATETPMIPLLSVLLRSFGTTGSGAVPPSRLTTI